VQNLEGSITSPSGLTERCDIIDLGNGRFTIKFVPKEMGLHAVSLKYNGLHIPGKAIYGVNFILRFHNLICGS
jgi:filamin